MGLRCWALRQPLAHPNNQAVGHIRALAPLTSIRVERLGFATERNSPHGVW